MTDRNTISQAIESLFEDWIEKNKNIHPLAVENMRLLEADALALLKEQEEETMFVYDEYTLPMCKKCGFHPFAGYIPTIKWMKERGYMKCPSCGRTVKWND